MPLKLEPVAVCYAVEVSLDAFERLLKREPWDCPVEKMLSTRLDRVPGVSKAEYNGHYGSNIFFTLDSDRDKPRIHARIIRLIEHATRATKKRKAADV